MGDHVKICKGCNRELPHSAFNKDNARPDGLRSRCRECAAAYFQSKYKDPEWKKQHNARSKQWRETLKSEAPEDLWAIDATANAKQRAKRGAFLCDIDVDYVRSLVVNTCPLLGLPIVYDQTKLSDRSPTLDRKNPALGYTRGNLAVISHRANRLKSDSTIEELEKLLKNLVQYMNSD